VAGAVDGARRKNCLTNYTCYGMLSPGHEAWTSFVNGYRRAPLRSRYERGELTIRSAAREYGIGCTECRRILNHERWRTLT
jgi:hypothetical protein